MNIIKINYKKILINIIFIFFVFNLHANILNNYMSIADFLNYSWTAKVYEGIVYDPNIEYIIILDFQKDWQVKISKIKEGKKIGESYSNFKIYGEIIYLYDLNYDFTYGIIEKENNKWRFHNKAQTITYKDFKISDEKKIKSGNERIILLGFDKSLILRELPDKNSKIIELEKSIMGGSFFIQQEKGEDDIIDGEKGYWIKVMTDKKVTGWIFHIQNKLFFSKVDTLRLRESPSIDGKIIRNLIKGEKLELLEKGKVETINGVKGTWVKVKTEQGEVGWCFDAYLEEVK